MNGDAVRRPVDLRLAAIERRFASGTPPFAVRGISLEVPSGTSLAVLGPSGSGKTTLVRIVAGLERPDAGAVYFGDRDVTNEPAERRRAGVVFAEDALFPHLTVSQNIAYGLPDRFAGRVRAVAERVAIAHLLERRARELSGGERQRAALARALAIEPAVLLLDEPLSRLDAPLRASVRRELATIVRGDQTTLLVTHDQSEAMVLGDRIAVLRDGALEQCGPPREVFDRPRTRFVASFVGNPAMSFLPAETIVRRSGAIATVGVRAPDVHLCALEQGDLDGVVRTVEDLGQEAYAHVETVHGTVAARIEAPFPGIGSRTGLRVDRAALHAFDERGMRVEYDARA